MKIICTLALLWLIAFAKANEDQSGSLNGEVTEEKSAVQHSSSSSVQEQKSLSQEQESTAQGHQSYCHSKKTRIAKEQVFLLNEQSSSFEDRISKTKKQTQNYKGTKVTSNTAQEKERTNDFSRKTTAPRSDRPESVWIDKMPDTKVYDIVDVDNENVDSRTSSQTVTSKHETDNKTKVVKEKNTRHPGRPESVWIGNTPDSKVYDIVEVDSKKGDSRTSLQTVTSKHETDNKTKVVKENNTGQPGRPESVWIGDTPDSRVYDIVEVDNKDVNSGTSSQTVTSKHETGNKTKVVEENNTRQPGRPESVWIGDTPDSKVYDIIEVDNKDVNSGTSSQTVTSKHETDNKMKVVEENNTRQPGRPESVWIGDTPDSKVYDIVEVENKNVNSRTSSQTVTSKHETDNKTKVVKENNTGKPGRPESVWIGDTPDSQVYDIVEVDSIKANNPGHGPINQPTPAQPIPIPYPPTQINPPGPKPPVQLNPGQPPNPGPRPIIHPTPAQPPVSISNSPTQPNPVENPGPGPISQPTPAQPMPIPYPPTQINPPGPKPPLQLNPDQPPNPGPGQIIHPTPAQSPVPISNSPTQPNPVENPGPGPINQPTPAQPIPIPYPQTQIIHPGPKPPVPLNPDQPPNPGPGPIIHPTPAQPPVPISNSPTQPNPVENPGPGPINQPTPAQPIPIPYPPTQINPPGPKPPVQLNPDQPPNPGPGQIIHLTPAQPPVPISNSPTQPNPVKHKCRRPRKPGPQQSEPGSGEPVKPPISVWFGEIPDPKDYTIYYINKDTENDECDDNDESSEDDTSVTERDTSETDKDTSVTDKDTSVTDKDTSVTDKDTSVADTDTSVTETDKYVRALQLQLTLNTVFGVGQNGECYCSCSSSTKPPYFISIPRDKIKGYLD